MEKLLWYFFEKEKNIFQHKKIINNIKSILCNFRVMGSFCMPFSFNQINKLMGKLPIKRHLIANKNEMSERELDTHRRESRQMENGNGKIPFN